MHMVKHKFNTSTYMMQFCRKHHGMLLSHRVASGVYGQPQTLDWKAVKEIYGYGRALVHALLSDAHRLLFQGIAQTSLAIGNPTLCTERKEKTI